MLRFRSTTVVVLWGDALFVPAIPVSGQCELHEDAKLTASDAAANDYLGNYVSISSGT